MLTLATPSRAQGASSMPPETAAHEGTWLQWPHRFTYGTTYRNQVEPSWVAMVRTLVESERVHLIVYDASEEARVRNLLTSEGIPLLRVDFLVRRTDDVWVRDNGPLFVHDASGRLAVGDFGFNGWGQDAPYHLDDTVPIGVASALGLPRRDLGALVLEGGAIELDGAGVLMATKSSILEPARNPGVTQAQAEATLRTQLGATKFLWLDGAPGGALDITDTHIDGFARFGPAGTLVTMSAADLAYWGISSTDIQRLFTASDAAGQPYSLVTLPLTRNTVRTTYGFDVAFKGSYVNFYVANRHVLMPTYADPNDALALQALQTVFPGRTVVGIDCRNLFRWGGMVHCVTQQQPEVRKGTAAVR
ncbi:MAG: agmatine deiminase family protein [Planctomycetota bacterium]